MVPRHSHKDTQHNNKNMTIGITTLSITIKNATLRITTNCLLHQNEEYLYAECHLGDSYYDECRHAEWC